MELRVIFSEESEIGAFYDEFTGSFPPDSVSVSVSIPTNTVSIFIRKSDVSVEKNIINMIKQYMRDKNINYKIEV